MKLKEFSFLFFGIALVGIIQFADASLYSYDESPLSITWTAVPNAVVTYNSTTGESTVYSQSVSGATHTFTRVLGSDGVSSDSVTIDCTPNGSTCYFWDVSVRGDIFGIGWASKTGTVGPGSTTFKFKSWNMSDGTETSIISATCSLGGGNTLYTAYSSAFNLDEDNDYMGVMAGQCAVSGHNLSRIILANGTTVYSGTGGFSNTQAGGSYSYLPDKQIIFENGTVTSFTGDFGHDATSFGNCDDDVCGGLDSTGSPTYINFGTETDFTDYVAISPDIKIYRQGVNATANLDNTIQDLWIDNFYDYDNINPILNLNNAILGEDLPTAVFLFTAGGTEYVGKLTTTGMSYALQSDFDFSDRAVQNYIADDENNVLISLDVEDALPEVGLSIQTPTVTVGSNSSGFFSLISGYSATIPTLLSSVNPSHSNFDTVLPYLVTPTSPVTTLIVEINNITTDYVVILKSSDTLFGQQYIWATVELDATKNFSVDLPTGECVEVWVHDASDDPQGVEESLGNLCASGTMPKEITYSQNLAFTFWTLEWGATHTYSQTTNYLTTKVRNENTQFDYTVEILHSNGSAFSSTPISANTTTYDLENFNVTGLDLPGIVRVLDNDGDLIYTANIGYANYLATMAVYFTTFFTIDGFNLLALAPIVFASMFTRNTVGIGSAMTVVVIATFSWFGVIVLSDAIIYLLVFIAIIGMIAYRQFRT